VDGKHCTPLCRPQALKRVALGSARAWQWHSVVDHPSDVPHRGIAKEPLLWAGGWLQLQSRTCTIHEAGEIGTVRDREDRATVVWPTVADLKATARDSVRDEFEGACHTLKAFDGRRKVTSWYSCD